MICILMTTPDLQVGNAFCPATHGRLGKESKPFQVLCFQPSAKRRYACASACGQYQEPLFLRRTDNATQRQDACDGNALNFRQAQLSPWWFGDKFLLSLSRVSPKTWSGNHGRSLKNIRLSNAADSLPGDGLERSLLRTACRISRHSLERFSFVFDDSGRSLYCNIFAKRSVQGSQNRNSYSIFGFQCCYSFLNFNIKTGLKCVF